MAAGTASAPVGYKVVFVPFRDGRPAGPPVDFVSGFRGDDGKTRGRPVGVTRGSARRADRRRRPVEHHLARDPCATEVPQPAPVAPTQR